MQMDVSATLLGIPMDVVRLIVALFDSRTLWSMQLVCKRTKLYTDQRVQEYMTSLPTRGEVMRWVQSCIESNRLLSVVWYIPAHIRGGYNEQGFPDQPMLVRIYNKPGAILTTAGYNTYYIDRNSEMLRPLNNTQCRLMDAPRQLLERLVPEGAIVDPITAMSVIVNRGLCSRHAAELVKRECEHVVECHIVTLLTNANALHSRTLLNCLIKVEGFAVQSYSSNDLLLPIDRRSVEEVSGAVAWSSGNVWLTDENEEDENEDDNISPNIMLANALTTYIERLKFDYEKVVHTNAELEHDMVPDHAGVVKWMKYRLTNRLPFKVSIYIPRYVVVIIEVVECVAVYRGYTLDRTGRSNRICMVPVPEDCLLEVILCKRRFPGMIDYKTLVQVIEWQIGESIHAIHAIHVKPIYRYIRATTRTEVGPLMSNGAQDLFGSHNNWETSLAPKCISTELHSLMLIGYFWMGLGSDALRSRLLQSLPVGKIHGKAVLKELKILYTSFMPHNGDD